MIIHEEKIDSNFEGTIIDLETIGFFNEYPDSRRYKDITPVLFGFIDNRKLKILCAKKQNSINALREKIKEILPTLKRPFHAFQSDFERGTLFHFMGTPVEFDSELNRKRFEKKERVVQALNISQHGDPFNGDGFSCMKAWLDGNVDKAIKHNRSCLLKERDILKLRGNRKPDKLTFKK
ncbi:hypothetical protein HZC30_03565 [Candidatus Woesearchaeota archaeon]|nr:hypothetical protein [Candidatus Woesearchaeota archaeon]